MLAPRTPDADIGTRALRHLQDVVAIDSQSDETSDTVPTTEGQRVLSTRVAGLFASLGAQVERDAHANVLARFPGRGAAAEGAPVAFLVHLDTARGTRAVPSLHVLPAWDGAAVPYPENPGLRVDLATYPAAACFLGQDIVHGPGEAPFGLDDKLGLTHLLTLATLLGEHPELSHPPLIFVGRPDEEVGRDEAVHALAARFVELGVRHAFTVDGILPFEINVENFNAAMARIVFPDGPVDTEVVLEARIGGVNTHGATAAAEGHRAAPRLVAEWAAACPELTVVHFASDAARDCDARVRISVPPGAESRAGDALAAVMAPHLPRGASFTLAQARPRRDVVPTTAAAAMIAWLRRFYASNTGFTLPCEASEGRDGYTHPFRANPVEGGLRLDLRIRDFEEEGLERRIAHVRALAPGADIVRQYVNMGPRLAAHPELVRWATEAAAAVGVTPQVTPIRGGTGVDPFLDRGIPVANLGTGYFSPESEKELTSVQAMVAHVRWLFALIQGIGG